MKEQEENKNFFEERIRLLTDVLTGLGYDQNALLLLPDLQKKCSTEKNASVSAILRDLCLITFLRNNIGNHTAAYDLYNSIVSDSTIFDLLTKIFASSQHIDEINKQCQKIILKKQFISFELQKNQEKIPLMAYKVITTHDDPYINTAIFKKLDLSVKMDEYVDVHKEFLKLTDGKIYFKHDIAIAGFTTLHLHDLTTTLQETPNPICFIAPRNVYQNGNVVGMIDRDTVREIYLERISKDAVEVKSNFLQKLFENFFDTTTITDLKAHTEQHQKLLTDFLTACKLTLEKISWLSEKHRFYNSLLEASQKNPEALSVYGPLVCLLDPALPTLRITQQTLSGKAKKLSENLNNNDTARDDCLEQLSKIATETSLIHTKKDKKLSDHKELLTVCTKALRKTQRDSSSSSNNTLIETRLQLLMLCEELTQFDKFSAYQVICYLSENNLEKAPENVTSIVERLSNKKTLEKYVTHLSENPNVSGSKKQLLLEQLFSLLLLTGDNDRDTPLSKQLDIVDACFKNVPESFLLDKYQKYIALLRACKTIENFPSCTTYRILKHLLENKSLLPKKLIANIVQTLSDKNRFDNYKKYFHAISKDKDKEQFIIALSTVLCDPSTKDIENKEISLAERLRLIAESSAVPNPDAIQLDTSNILTGLPGYLDPLKKKIAFLQICNGITEPAPLVAYKICMHLYDKKLLDNLPAPTTQEGLKKLLLNPTLIPKYIEYFHELIKPEDTTIQNFINEQIKSICSDNSEISVTTRLDNIAKCLNTKSTALPNWLSPENKQTSTFLLSCETAKLDLGGYKILRYLETKNLLRIENTIIEELLNGNFFMLYLDEIKRPEEKLELSHAEEQLRCIINQLKSSTQLKSSMHLGETANEQLNKTLREILGKSKVRDSVPPGAYTAFETYLEDEKQKAISRTNSMDLNASQILVANPYQEQQPVSTSSPDSSFDDTTNCCIYLGIYSGAAGLLCGLGAPLFVPLGALYSFLVCCCNPDDLRQANPAPSTARGTFFNNRQPDTRQIQEPSKNAENNAKTPLIHKK